MPLFDSGIEYSEHEKKHILIKVNVKDKSKRERLYEILSMLANNDNQEAKTEFIKFVNGPSSRDPEFLIDYPKYKGFNEVWCAAPDGLLDHVIEVKKARQVVYFCIELQDINYSSSQIEDMLILFMFAFSNKIWARLRGNVHTKERVYEEFDYCELADVIRERESDEEWNKI